jgi:hypothetical protein
MPGSEMQMKKKDIDIDYHCSYAALLAKYLEQIPKSPI